MTRSYTSSSSSQASPSYGAPAGSSGASGGSFCPFRRRLATRDLTARAWVAAKVADSRFSWNATKSPGFWHIRRSLMKPGRLSTVFTCAGCCITASIRAGGMFLRE